MGIVSRSQGQSAIGAVLFDSTIVGADAASIDTGANGIAQTFNVLEIWVVSRTDDAAALAVLNVTLNNDGGANYDQQYVRGNNAAASAAAAVGGAAWALFTHGTGGRAGVPGVCCITIPSYTGAVFEKGAEARVTAPDSTAANEDYRGFALHWRSAAAISRLAVAASGVQKLKVGSRLLILGR